MEEKIYKKTTIEIDCDPWTGMGCQQDHYIACCELIGAEPQPRISACFGCWEWPITYKTKEDQKIVGNYLKSLYGQGRIRYASW